jgi:predicted CXXCH cytochrome family protein
MCQAHIPGICAKVACDVHHTYAGSNRQQYFLEVETWKALCRMCHTWVHNNPKSAKELGLLK